VNFLCSSSIEAGRCPFNLSRWHRCSGYTGVSLVSCKGNAWRCEASCMLQGSAGPAMVALVQQGLGWVPTACNLAAALAFGLCLSLNAHLTGGSDLSILAIAPLLLLLTQVLKVPLPCTVSPCTIGNLPDGY
jgi:hypothetical protein